MPATINDVARLAGVHKRTVTRVINNLPHVSPAVRARVEAAIAELGFVPHSAARQLASNRAFTLGIAQGPVPADILAMLLAGASEGVKESGYALVFAQHDPDDPASIAGVCDFAWRRQIDGLTLSSSVQDVVAQFAALLPAGFPWVNIGSCATPPGVPAISVDDGAGAYAIAGHLLGLGHRRIAYTHGAGDVPEARQTSFAAALAARDIRVDPRYVLTVAHSGFDDGFAVGQTLLALSPRPTAICALNDGMAVGVLAAAQAMGVRVPAELSVTGYDDFAIAQQSRPTLTTVRIPAYEMSRGAVEILISMIAGEPPPANPVRFAPTLVIRQSTGPCPIE